RLLLCALCASVVKSDPSGARSSIAPRGEQRLELQEIEEVEHAVLVQVGPRLAGGEGVLEGEEVEEGEFAIAIEVGDAGAERGQQEGPYTAAGRQPAEADDLSAVVDGAGIGERPAGGGVDQFVEVAQGAIAPDDSALAVNVADEVLTHAPHGDTRIVHIVD